MSAAAAHENKFVYLRNNSYLPMKRITLAAAACWLCAGTALGLPSPSSGDTVWTQSAGTATADTLPAQPGGRKRVAVVLSGGGAKGMAHIGVLKVLERAGIPVDMVAGTSMGAIVGGLYAVGYNAGMLDSLVRAQDWSFLLSDREDMSWQSLANRQKQQTYALSHGIGYGKESTFSGGIIRGKNLGDLFQQLTVGYADSISFDSLPIPFSCVATDIVDYSEFVFHGGVLANAMRASMAIPAVFSPVRYGQRVLVDGGLRNNFPVDVARSMGADLVVGITLQGEPKSADDLLSPSSILGQIVDVNCKNKFDENVAQTDLHIHIDTRGYTAASFSAAAVDTLVRRGEEEAMRHWDELMALKARIGLHDGYTHRPPHPKFHLAAEGRVPVRSIEFENVEMREEQFLRSKFRLHDIDSIDAQTAERIATSMRVDLSYDKAASRFVPESGSYRVVFVAGEKKRGDVNIGMRFDSEEMAALQANLHMPLHTRIPMDIELTARLGKRLMGRADAVLHPRSAWNPTFAYIFRRNDIDLYSKGRKAYNITYNQHSGTLMLRNQRMHNLNVGAGIRWDYFHFSNVLTAQSHIPVPAAERDQHLVSYQVAANYNSENDGYFPTRGAHLWAKYAYVTDNFGDLRGQAGLSDASILWRVAIPLSRRLTLQPTAYGRLLFGNSVPAGLRNMIGGNSFGHYTEQQLPFAGMGHTETTDAHFAALQLQAQERIGRRGYAVARVAAALRADKFDRLFSRSPMMGYQVGYYYQTPFGPVGAAIGATSHTDRAYMLVSLGYEF